MTLLRRPQIFGSAATAPAVSAKSRWVYVFIVSRISLWRMSFWATLGETPLRASSVAKVWRRQ